MHRDNNLFKNKNEIFYLFKKFVKIYFKKRHVYILK